MGFCKFFSSLLIIAALAIGLVTLLQYGGFLPSSAYEISLGSVGLFSVFCLIIYLVAVRLASSANIYQFNNVVLISVLGKLALTMAFLAVFRKIYMPESKFVYVPFLLFYILYTIFETYFLTIIGKQKKS
ncbi:MAG TPA: hypothetical protein PKN57_11190 [Saprospiraceae bacterium]|nr:hypothetical protein [Saprospiraceae bacterium]MCC6688761.1 hypothetical protein [Saprospiraceae bacterium]HMV22905.1 hypothetical protein [Saprospiraceae bacterium]HMW74417.1 hypothetical protein [Saprospiraceae bacterium]HMX82571.1 hypothetical protein [Saprospiraceae bacterium]